MKKGARVLGVDDSAFEYEDSLAFLTGVVYRGTEFIEDIETVEIEVDGGDAAERVEELFFKCNNPGQVKAVLLDGICFAGFNFVDIEKVSRRIDRPVIAVTSNRPDRDRFREAMEKSGNYDDRIEEMDEAVELELEDGTTYLQFSGCEREEAEEIVSSTIIHGLTPEPIRVADMIGSSF